MKHSRWASLFVAAFMGLLALPVDAAYTRIETGLQAIESAYAQDTAPSAAEAPADAWLVESVIPLGFTDDGQHIELVSFLVPLSGMADLAPVTTRAGPYVPQKTHTRVFCIVQSPLGLAPFSYKYGGGDKDFSVEAFVPEFAPKPVPYEPPVFVNPGPGPDVYRKERVIARNYSYEWVGPAGRFYSANDVPGFAMFETDARAPRSSSWVDGQRYEVALARELRTGDAHRYERNLGTYYMANALLYFQSAYSLKAGLATRPAAAPAFAGNNAWGHFRSAYKDLGLSVKKGPYFSFSQGYNYMQESPFMFDVWRLSVHGRAALLGSSGTGAVRHGLVDRSISVLYTTYGGGLMPRSTQFGIEAILAKYGPLGPGAPYAYHSSAGAAGFIFGTAWEAYNEGIWNFPWE
jgi:hypothetical protein